MSFWSQTCTLLRTQDSEASLTSNPYRSGFGLGETFFSKLTFLSITLLIRMKNNNPSFLSSRGDNFLLKNIFFFEIRKKLKILEKLKFQFSKFLRFFGDFWDLLDFPLCFLYKRKGKSSKSRNFRDFRKSKFSLFSNFLFFFGFRKFLFFI